jgi:predicted Zn-dependent protease
MTTKTEEQAEKDKEAVQKMIGAKSAMEAAIRRIENLERALKGAKSRFEELNIAHGDKIALSVYRDNGWKYISAKEFTRKAINDIDDAL